MAEVKNAFIKSKMNKDLDSRLLPSGEYRNAINAQVSKSEGADVGALENVLGNTKLTNFGLNIAGVKSIGYCTDESNSVVYVFLTDNTGSAYVPTGAGSNHFIYKYVLSSSSPAVKLAEGAFLNFSQNSPIYGVNLLEDVLFWTDNRNQPRKINVTSAATPGYYSCEDNVSVARYNPYKPIELYKESLLSPTNYETTMKDVSSKYLSDGGSCTVDGAQTGFDFVITDLDIPFLPSVPYIGQEVVYIDSGGVVQQIGAGATVTGWDLPSSTVSISVSTTLDDLIELVFNPNPYYIPSYSGDPKFLEDKFIRFSYRYKFDDGEYSIMAPFTQVCYIPKQDGYFLNNTSTEGDQQQAFSSTIVDFMENKVNKIDLQIPLPASADNLASDFHIQEIDILYKESDGLTVKVVETIPVNANFTGASDIFQYEYQSQIPYKTLPTSDIIRVYDKVPVKALAQEIISNRVVYGNYQDKHTPPSFLNYNVSANSKSVFSLKTGTATVNGNVVASDEIILSAITGTINAGSSVSGVGIPSGTIVNSYDGLTAVVSQVVTVNSGVSLLFEPSSGDSNSTSVIEYPSSTLKTNRNYQVGFVLSDKFGRQSTVILSSDREAAQIAGGEFRGSTVYSPYENDLVNPIEWLGNSLKVSVNDPIGPVSRSINGSGEPGVYNDDVTSLDYNPLGWYSYKIVVKQTEQEYYNVYTAGAMKGLPFDYETKNIGSLSQNTSFVTLINDNINKVPRDLSEVGPQDKSFRSSVTLFGRVENLDNNINTGNKQYFPGRRPFTTSSIEDLNDLFDVNAFKNGFPDPIPVTDPLNAYYGFFKSDSDPFIAEIVTSQAASGQFGINNSVTVTTGTADVLTVVANSVEIECTSALDTIEVGSVLTWPSMPAIGADFIVVSTTGGITPIITVNRNISLPVNTALTFTLSLYDNIKSLAIFETSPVESRLDIFWETSSTGLVTDLNNLVLNSSNAGADFSSWNDAAFNEGIALGDDILTANFQIQDNFGANIVLGALDTFTMTSVLDQRSPTPVDTSTWFELYEVGLAGSSVYNIRTTADFVSNVYYSETAGSNDFNFSFQSFINDVYTNINRVANLSNVAPTMKGPDSGGTSPDPAVDFTISGNTSTEDIFTMTAVNGANSAGFLTGEDIDWSLTAVDSSGSSVSYFGVDYTNTPTLSTCIIKNNDINNAIAQTYTFTLRCIDAGGAYQEVIVTANLGVIPTSVTDNVFNFDDNYGSNSVSYIVITVALGDDPLGWNGTYIINGSWSSISTGVDNITIKLNAGCSDNPYIFNVDAFLALSAYKACYAPGYGPPIQTITTSVTNFLDWSYEVI